MTASEISDKAWLAFPFIYRNNRGCIKTKHGFIRYGIPLPNGIKESDDAMKGADFIGFHEIEITSDMVGKKIAVFTSIEIKTKHDRLKEGQKRWHRFVLEHGGRSEIWQEMKDGSIEIIKGVI
jgi:ribosomal protein S19